ncbi:MAG: hypothetical protein ACK486_14135, partial [Cyanobacteriota bacterium]
LTVEGRAQGGRGLSNAGVGATLLVADRVLAQAAVAGSSASAPARPATGSGSAKERCPADSSSLAIRMGELRQAEAALAAVKSEQYRPVPAPPPLEEAQEARYRPEDQELDREHHAQAMAAWEAAEAARSRRWAQDHDQRLADAQGRLDQIAAELQQRRGDLFTGPGSIEFNPQVAEAIRLCQA